MKKLKILISLMIYSSIILSNGLVFPQTSQSKDKGKTYTIAYLKNIFFDVDVNDVQAALKVWLNEALKIYDPSKRNHFVNKVYSSINEINEAISKDNIIIVSLTAYDFLTYKNYTKLEPVCVPETEGDVGVQYYLLVKKGKNYKGLKDLKGKTIGLISTPALVASSLWLDVLLARNKLPDKNKFFERVEGNKKQSQLILSVFFENLDACIVSKETFKTMKELNPQIDERIEILMTSPLYTAGLICFPVNNQEKEIREGFLNSLLELHNRPVGKQIFTLLKIGRLIPARDEYFESFISLLKEHKKTS